MQHAFAHNLEEEKVDALLTLSGPEIVQSTCRFMLEDCLFYGFTRKKCA